MVAGTHQRKLVGDLRMLRQDFGDLKIRGPGTDRFEGATNFCSSIGLHVKRVQLTRGPQIENHDARTLIFAAIDLAMFLGCEVLWQREADCPKCTDLHEISTRCTIARGGRATTLQAKHLLNLRRK